MASCSCPKAQNLKNLTCWVQVDGGHDADDDANGDDDDDADKDDEDGVDDDVSNYTDVKEDDRLIVTRVMVLLVRCASSVDASDDGVNITKFHAVLDVYASSSTSTSVPTDARHPLLLARPLNPNPKIYILSLGPKP